MIGEVDGQRGRPLSELNRYRRQCAAHGVVPDTQVYTEARERGLALYCTPSNGYREVRSGASYELVCPVALEPEFQRSHQLGSAVYTSLERLRDAGRSIQFNRRQVENLRNERDDLLQSLRDDDISGEQRRENLDEIEAIDNRIDRLEDDIIDQGTDLTAAIATYTGAVEEAGGVGYDEPMELELIRELERFSL